MTNQPEVTDRWVDERLATLTPAGEWEPDAARLSALRTRRAALQARRLRWTAGSLVIALVFVAVPVTRAFGTRCLEACAYATAQVAQLWRADEPAAATPKVFGAGVGDLAPDNLGVGPAGMPVSLASLRGHVVIVNFWATWCGPCRSEVPLLNALRARYGAQGLDVVGVSLDDDGWPAIKSFTNGVPVAYSLTLGTDGVSTEFGGVKELPATFVIDRDGVIAAHMTGPLREGTYDQLIERLLR